VFEADGAVLWQKATQDASSQSTGSSVYDFEGDGAADVVYNDEVRLRVYAGHNGTEKLNILGHGSGTMFEYPLVVDVDNDGQAEIVVVNNNYAYGTKAGVSGVWRSRQVVAAGAQDLESTRVLHHECHSGGLDPPCAAL
jgi:hypothetical protein